MGKMIPRCRSPTRRRLKSSRKRQAGLGFDRQGGQVVDLVREEGGRGGWLGVLES